MNVLVTGGGTIAPIDDVRHIANVSTGRFSAEIAESCLRRGAVVRHVHAPTAALPFHRLARFDLERADVDREIERLVSLRSEFLSVRDRLHLHPLREGTVSDYARTLYQLFREVPIDVIFLAMAVSDYEPAPFSGKLRSEGEPYELLLQPTPKIIRTVRDRLPDVYLVGFKLLSGSTPEELVSRARESGEANRADLTVANDLGPLRQDRHTIHLVRPGQPVATLGPGGEIADRLVERVLSWASEKARGEAVRGG